MAAIPSIGAAAVAVAGGGSSTHQGTLLELQRPYPSAELIVERRGRRRLQVAGDECEGDFTVNSLLWADSAGCYTDLGNSLYEYTAGTVTYVIGAIPMYNSADAPSVWVAGEVMSRTASSVATLDPHCHSEGDITVHSHPADVEFWLCDIDNTNTAYTEMTPNQFSTECGCAAGGEEEVPATTTAPAAPTTPPPVAATRDLGTPAPVAAEASAPAAAVPGTTAPVAAEAPTPAAVAETDAPVMVEPPTPAAAVTETPAPVMVEAPTLAAAVTDAPVTVEAPTPAAAADTIAPAQPVMFTSEEEEEEEVQTTISTSVTSDTPNGLCGEIQPLTVVTSSPLLADLEGCYEETGHEYHEEGGHFFSITESHLRGQMAIFPGYVDAASMDARWFLGFVAVSAAETLVYCISAQPPSAGHPSTANWYCDDGTGNFPLNSDNEFNILCGCGTESSMTTDSAIDSTSESQSETVAEEPTTPPVVGEATEPPAHGSATSHESATSSTHDGATGHPSHARTATPTSTPVAAVPTLAPAPPSGLTPLGGGSSAPVAVATGAPVAGHTSDHGGSGHTTSAADEDHHSGTDDHSGTPSPTTVARGIIAASETPAPTVDGFESASTSGTAALTPGFPFFDGASGEGAAAAVRTVVAVAVAVAVAGLFAAVVA